MKKQAVFKLLAIALTAALTVSTVSLPTFAAVPTISTQAVALRNDASNSNDVTYTLDVTGENGVIHMDGSDADKIVNVEQGSRLFITLPSNVGANVGSSDVGTVNPMKKTLNGYDLNVTTWGDIGSKTGMFFNGKKLFTVCCSQHSGDWNDDAAPVVHLKGVNAKYGFSVTTPASASVSVNTGNGQIGTIDRLKQGSSYLNDTTNSDGTVTHYFSSRAFWGSCSFGVYIHVDGKQYLIFRCSIDGSQTPTHTYSAAPSQVTDFHGARWGTTSDYEYSETIRMAKEWLNSSTTQENIQAETGNIKSDEEYSSGTFQKLYGIPYTQSAVRLLAIKYAIGRDFDEQMLYTDGSAYRVFKTRTAGGCYDDALFSQVIYQLAGYDCKLAWGSAGDPNCEGDNHITTKVCVDGKWYYSGNKYYTPAEFKHIFSVIWGEGYNDY